MSTVAAIEKAAHELALVLPPITATRHLSIAGVVILLYDHLLLLHEEKNIIWVAKWSYFKVLFLMNRYLTPISLLISMYGVYILFYRTANWSIFLIHQQALSGISSVGLSTQFCKTWIPLELFIDSITPKTHLKPLVFVVQRVWALWARDNTIKYVLLGAFFVVYLSTYTTMGVAVSLIIPFIELSPTIGTCILLSKPKALITISTLQITLDLLIFALTCWNAFARPRDLQAVIAKQLLADGAFYFAALLGEWWDKEANFAAYIDVVLRLFNIFLIAVADVAYTQLGVYFIWAMITVLINRLLVTSGTVEVYPGPDPSGRETPFRLPEHTLHFDNLNQEDEEGSMSPGSPYLEYKQDYTPSGTGL
ncbi:hypothetical protein K439DRAFT_1615684 [Ramaria rubella]|nr:hypothetical protein K439DRAFT_1615684 [Ramaria rubella]